jgi:hypothetical protein
MRSIIGARLGSVSAGDCASAAVPADETMSHTAAVDPKRRTTAAFLA